MKSCWLYFTEKISETEKLRHSEIRKSQEDPDYISYSVISLFSLSSSKTTILIMIRYSLKFDRKRFMQYHFISFTEHINPSIVKELTSRFAMNGAGKDHVELLECTLQLRSFKHTKRVSKYQWNSLTNKRAFYSPDCHSLVDHARSFSCSSLLRLQSKIMYKIIHAIEVSCILQESLVRERIYTNDSSHVRAYSHANPTWYDDLESC